MARTKQLSRLGKLERHPFIVRRLALGHSRTRSGRVQTTASSRSPEPDRASVVRPSFESGRTARPLDLPEIPELRCAATPPRRQRWSASGEALSLFSSRLTLRLCLLSFVVGLAACETVPFYDREALNDPTMIVDEDPTGTHFEQKTRYSREGSVGGIGAGAGGGCGCY